MTDLEKIHKIWNAYDEVMEHTSLTQSKNINYQISEITDIDEKTIKGFFKVVDSAAQFINDRLYRGEITISEALDLMKNNNNELKPMEQIKKVVFYTEEQTEEMISILKSGKINVNELSRQLAVKYGKTIFSLRFKLYDLKKKLNLTKGRQLDKVRVGKVINNIQPLNFEPNIEQKPAEIGIEVPHGMTFEGKPKKIMLHSDHFRIYF
jgi:hypothetical protein